VTEGVVETVVNHDVSGRGLAILLLLSFVFAWTGVWLLTRWWGRAADKGYILVGGTLTTTDPEKYRRSSEAMLTAQKRIAVVWRKSWPLAALASLVTLVLVVIGLT
jgi:hypothetical protein